MNEVTQDAHEVSPLPLMRISSGLWAARTMAVAHAFGVFDLARPGSAVTVSECAARLGIAQRPAELLLTACAGLDLLHRTENGGYENTPVAEAYLVSGSPNYFGGVVQLFDKHSAPGWMRLEEALRENRPTSYDANGQTSLFDNPDPSFVRGFWEGMYSLSIWTARVFAEHVEFGDDSRVLDVGGGGAPYDIVLCQRYPGLRATVYDLPQVAGFAREKISAAGLSDRIRVAEGNFLTDPDLPGGHDTIILSMILHDWGVPECRLILEKCLRALPPGGRVVISELLVDDTKDGPLDATLMSIHMLVETFGRNYTAHEYTTWLTEVGFERVRTTRFAALSANGAVIAHKPG
jgi:SAM-dependent methyltransferase